MGLEDKSSINTVRRWLSALLVESLWWMANWGMRAEIYYDSLVRLGSTTTASPDLYPNLRKIPRRDRLFNVAKLSQLVMSAHCSSENSSRLQVDKRSFNSTTHLANTECKSRFFHRHLHFNRLEVFGTGRWNVQQIRKQ